MKRYKSQILKEAGIVVYDNGGDTIDRYTVIIGKDAYGMCNNPLSPQGFNQYAGEVGTDIKLGSHLGKKVNPNSLPDIVKKAIKIRQDEN